MKTIRNLMILSGLCLALFALAVTGARAQTLAWTSFTGTFALPLETHFGAMTLPAGDYTLSYGRVLLGGRHMVTVEGQAEGGPRGMILAGPGDDVSAAKDALLCVREGDTLYVRALEMPLIGESAHFRIPHGVEVRSRIGPIEKAHNQGGKNQFSVHSVRSHGGVAGKIGGRPVASNDLRAFH